MKSPSEDVKRFVAGFGDGDGHITIQQATTRPRADPPKVIFYQSRNDGAPPELLYIQEHYESVLHSRPQRRGARTEWRLEIRGPGVKAILGDWASNGVVKARQAEIALEYMNADDRKSVAPRYSALLKQTKASAISPVHTERMVPAYLAGLFAADGCVGVYRSGEKYWVSSASIISAHEEIRRAIHSKVGEGCVNAKAVVFWSNQAARFGESILPHLHGSKVEQLKYMLDFQKAQSSKGWQFQKRTPEELKELEDMSNKMKKMKRM